MKMNSKSDLDKITLDVHHNDSCIYFSINDSYDMEEYDRQENGFICIKNSGFIKGEETKKYVLEKISDPKFILSENGQFYMIKRIDNCHNRPQFMDLNFFYHGKNFITKIKQRSRKNKVLRLLK